MDSVFRKLALGLCLICIVYLCNEIYWKDKFYYEIEEAYEFLQEDVDSLYQLNEYLINTMDSLPLGSPITDTIKISSNYGGRKNPFGTGWRFHTGLDIHAWIYDTIYATGDGIVKNAYWMGGYGRCVVISHSGGYESMYAHLYRMFVKKGDTIQKGQAIGRAGNSGAVTGPHLHYEIRRNNKSTDPIEYINFPCIIE